MIHTNPNSGVHYWLQKASSIRKTDAAKKAEDDFEGMNKSMEKYHE